MLNLNQIDLKQNLLLIEEYPVQVEETINGVRKPQEAIEKEKLAKRFRVGKVIAAGWITDDVKQELPLSLFKGEKPAHEEIIGKEVIYTANGAELVDLPVEGTKILVTNNARYIFAALNE